jgi:hypothetical protein
MKYKGKLTFVEYDFVIVTKEDFLDPEKKIMPDGKGYTFLLCSPKNDDEISNVHVIGTTISKQSVIDHFDALAGSHIAYIEYNPHHQKPYIDEYMVLEFKPKQIWFLDKDARLVYVPELSNG